MKVAVLFYGQPRNFHRGYENIQEFIWRQKGTQFDFFYHCWVDDNCRGYIASTWSKVQKEYLKYDPSIKQKLLDMYKPIVHEYQDIITEFHLENTIGLYNSNSSVNINNTISQMYSRNKTRNIFNKYVTESGVRYDMVIMTRFDTVTVPALYIDRLDPSKVYVDHPVGDRNYIPDNFIVCSQEVLIKWFDIYDKINIILNDPLLEKSVSQLGEGFRVNPEELILMKYIHEYGTLENIVRFDGFLLFRPQGLWRQ
jgi:hypothetical protein